MKSRAFSMQRGMLPATGFMTWWLLIASVGHGASAGKEIDSLIADLRSDDYHAAWNAASELGEFSDHRETVADALVKALGYEWPHCSGDIREAIAVSLERLDASEAVFPMLSLLEEGKNTEHECAECGCCFVACAPGDVLLGRRPDPFCDNSYMAAIHRLADFSHSKAMADLASAGVYTPAFLIILGEVGPPRYANFIAKYANSEDKAVQEAVAIALGTIRNPDVSVPILAGYLGSAKVDFHTRWIALESLIAIGKGSADDEVSSRLAAIMNGDDPLSAVLAARGLAFLGVKAGLEALRAFSLHEAGVVRFEAVLCIGELADAGSREEVVTRLDDDLPEVRAGAIYALGRIGEASDLGLLQRAFEDARRHADQYHAATGEGQYPWDFDYSEYFLRDAYHDAVREISARAGEKP